MNKIPEIPEELKGREIMDQKDLPFEIRTCHTIGEFDRLREKASQHKFEMDHLEKVGDRYTCNSLPIDLSIDDEIYVLTSWNSNHYIKSKGAKEFEVIESYGEKLRTGKNYLIIAPCY